MKETDRHSWDLAQLFQTIAQDVIVNTGVSSSILKGAEWLRLASAIREVRIDTTRFDRSYGWCEPADDRTQLTDALHSDATFQLSRFLFIWAALEVCADTVTSKSQLKKQGMVACFIALLNRRFRANEPELAHLHDVVAEVFQRASAHSLMQRIQGRSLLGKHASVAGFGLYLVATLRNIFVHGALDLPEPLEWASDNPADYLSLVENSSRLVLLVLQEVLSDLVPPDSLIDTPLNETFAVPSKPESNVIELCRTVHLHHRGSPIGQQSFEFALKRV